MPSHQKIIEISKKLFPMTTNVGGMCHGVAMIAVQAILAGKIDSFNKLLALFKKMPKDAFDDISSTISEHDTVDTNTNSPSKNDPHAIDKLINEKMTKFTTKHDIIFKLEWQDLIDVEAFFSGVNLYMTPQHSEFASLFESKEARPKTEFDNDRLLPLLPINVIKKNEPRLMDLNRHHDNSMDSSNDVIQQKTIHPVISFSGCYNEDELLDYFETFAKVYKSSNTSNLISFILANHNHAITIGYDPNKHQDQPWIFIDANNLPAKQCDTYSIVDYVFNVLKGDDNHVYFNTTVYAIKNVVNEIVIQDKSKSTKLTDEERNTRLSDRLERIKNANERAEALFNEMSEKLHSEAWKKCPEINTASALRVSSKTGNTWLCIAAMGGHFHQAKTLIEKGARLDHANERGITPLWMAAYRGYENIVKVLIEAKTNIDQADSNGATPLWIAANNDHEKIVKVLIKEGADIDQVNNDGLTPLFAAVQNGHENVVNILLTHGADTGITLEKTTKQLMELSQKCSVEIQSRVSEFINGRTGQIEVRPSDIARIMGHKDIANLIDNHIPRNKILSGNEAAFFSVRRGSDITINDKKINLPNCNNN